jgi:uncharacterized protein YlxW (UPF0749 family)
LDETQEKRNKNAKADNNLFIARVFSQVNIELCMVFINVLLKDINYWVDHTELRRERNVD